MGNQLSCIWKKWFLGMLFKIQKVRVVSKKGMFDLRVWPGVEGSEKTPGKAPDRGKEQMQRLAKLAKKHRNGHMPKVCLVTTKQSGQRLL
jgi:hypothetical protein